MLKIRNSIQLSASDLVGHLNCRYLTDLDIAVANGAIKKPHHWDPLLDTLRERGASMNGIISTMPEEADQVRDLVTEILNSDTTWIDRTGAEQPVRLEDIPIIAPYNAQVFKIQESRTNAARVGTVDKFQGQEAPIVIYSITTSSQADAPRGMEFLYSPNRFNVATSRAKCLCIVVGSPSVFEAECRTPTADAVGERVLQVP
jgi:hypothetical protein